MRTRLTKKKSLSSSKRLIYYIIYIVKTFFYEMSDQKIFVEIKNN